MFQRAYGPDTPLASEDNDAFRDWARERLPGMGTSLWDDSLSGGFLVWLFAATGHRDDVHVVGQDWNESGGPNNCAWYATYARGRRVWLARTPTWQETIDLLNAMWEETPLPAHLLGDPSDVHGRPPAPRRKTSRATPLTDADRDAIVAAYTAGQSLESVGRQFDVSTTTVSRLVRKAGAQVRPANERKVPEAVRAQIAADYAAGASTVTLSERYGLAQSTVTDIITEQGGLIRARGKRLTPAERDAVAREYQAGRASPEIAAAWGVSKQTVLAIVREHGLDVRGH